MAEKSNKRGLGAGLGALFGEDSLQDSNTGAMNVPISKVEPRADQPRRVFNEEALQELSDSIAQFGVIQPITVRKLDSGYYQIIAGERRWRASRLAGLKEVPIRIIEADDKRAMELALVENLQREDLNPIEEAKGYRTLMQEYGMTQEEASQSVGKSRPAVANALRLLNLAPPVMEMVENGKLSAGHARAILALRADVQQLSLSERIIKDGLSVRQAESLAGKMSKGEEVQEEKKESSEIKVDYIAEVEKRLTAALGRKIAIKDSRGKGKIELSFYGSDDRETLIDQLLSLGKNSGGEI